MLLLHVRSHGCGSLEIWVWHHLLLLAVKIHLLGLAKLVHPHRRGCHGSCLPGTSWIREWVWSCVWLEEILSPIIFIRGVEAAFISGPLWFTGLVSLVIPTAVLILVVAVGMWRYWALWDTSFVAGWRLLLKLSEDVFQVDGNLLFLFRLFLSGITFWRSWSVLLFGLRDTRKRLRLLALGQLLLVGAIRQNVLRKGLLRDVKLLMCSRLLLILHERKKSC